MVLMVISLARTTSTTSTALSTSITAFWLDKSPHHTIVSRTRTTGAHLTTITLTTLITWGFGTITVSISLLTLLTLLISSLTH